MKLLASIFACILLVVFAGCQNKAQTHTDKELVDSLNAIPPGPVVVLAVGTGRYGESDCNVALRDSKGKFHVWQVSQGLTALCSVPAGSDLRLLYASGLPILSKADACMQCLNR